MRKALIVASIAALFCLTGVVRNSLAATVPVITLVQSFELPGASSTSLAGINNSRAVVGGAFPNSSGSTFQFELVSSTVSEIAFPGATGFTNATGINDSGEVAGYYQNGIRFYGGFFLQNGVYTSFSEGATCPGGVLCNTAIYGINNLGDFVGYWEPNNVGLALQAFVDIGGVFTNVTVPSVSGSAYMTGIDNHSAKAVGNYYDVNSRQHGLIYNVTTKTLIHADFPGALVTVLSGINLKGAVSGSDIDSLGAEHAVVQACGGQWASYDFPGALSTKAYGINDKGIISGSYADSVGNDHGLELKVACVPAS